MNRNLIGSGAPARVRWMWLVAALAWAPGCDDGGGDADGAGGADGDAATGGSNTGGAGAGGEGGSASGGMAGGGTGAVGALDAGPVDPDAALPPDQGTLEAEDAPLTVRFTADGGVALQWDGQTRLRVPADGFQLGVVESLDEAFNYDPWYQLAGPISALPRGLEWIGPEAVTADAAQDSVGLLLDYGDLGMGVVEFRVESGDRIAAVFTPPPGSPTAYFRIRAEVDPEEGFYGLGGVLDTPNHRGKIRALQTEVDLEVESVNNEANTPIPLLIGSTGWGVFIEEDHPIAMDVAAEADDRVDFYVGKGLDASDGMRFHLFAEAHPLDITRFYYDVTGTPRLPAKWAYGPLLWRDENQDQAEVESDISIMRELDLACSAIWIDRPYASGVNSFDFLPSQFPDAQAMIDRAHALGYRMSLWHTAYTGVDQEATAHIHNEALENGYYPPLSGAVPRWGGLVDLTNPEAYDWWQGLIERYTTMGIEGFKLDYVQDIVVGVGPTRNRWEFSDGSTERTMHKRYQELYHRVYAETLPEEGGFLLTRTAVYGDQVNGVVIWPGDLDANMALHKERMDGYVAVGGMPASMVVGLSLGPAGLPFYGADTGGYRHCPPDKETFTRWFQQTALSSVMQIGTSCNDVAWEFEEANGFDQEMLDWYRTYTRLHLRLFPYAWTYATENPTTGRPIQRPYGYQMPELGTHPWDVYFFGDDLLVAPVVEHGARGRTVPFPPGTWYDWWTGEAIEGGVDMDVDAPLSTLPLYLKAGGIIPMLRPTIDTLSPTTEPDTVDSYVTTPGRLYARVANGEEGEFTVYDGTELIFTIQAGGVTFEIAPGEQYTHGAQVEFIGLDGATGATGDGEMLPEVDSLAALEMAEAGWFLDAETGAVHVRAAPGATRIEVATP